MATCHGTHFLFVVSGTTLFSMLSVAVGGMYLYSYAVGVGVTVTTGRTGRRQERTEKDKIHKMYTIRYRRVMTTAGTRQARDDNTKTTIKSTVVGMLSGFTTVISDPNPQTRRTYRTQS